MITSPDVIRESARLTGDKYPEILPAAYLKKTERA